MENAPSFDFEGHRRHAVDAYAKIRSKYQEFAFAVRNILREAIERKELKVHSVEARAKSLDSFGDKAMRPSEEDPDLPKYREPSAGNNRSGRNSRYYFFPAHDQGGGCSDPGAVPGPGAG
jgi:hypothetical protein